jgi:hypothetical protein
MRKIFTLFIISFIGFITALYFFRFSLPDSHIVKCSWKADGSSPGGDFGDVLAFDDPSVKMESGYIYRNGVVVAQITERKFRFLAGDYITLKDIKTGVLGTYYEKGCK